MAAFKLGADDITAVYLGSQGICIVNDGADNVFDDGCGAQFTVTHTISDGISGSQYTVSTVPSSSKTGSTGDPYSFTTSVSPDSGYEFTSGPTISPSQPLTGTIGSADSTVTTTITGTVSLIPTGSNVVATLSLDTSAISGPAAGWYVTGDPDGDAEVGDTSSVTYNFSSGAALNSDYEWVGSPPAPANSGTNTIYASATISTALGGATVRLIQYTVTQNLTNNVQGPSAGYNLTWNGNSNYTTSTGTATESGTVGVSYSFPATTLTTNSGYTATSALTLSGEGAISGTFATGPTTYQVTAGGTVALSTSSITLGGVSRACANYSCIIPGAGSQQSTTWYYTGSFGVGTVLWSNSDLTGSQPSAGFWKNISGSGSVEYGAGSVSSTPSCVSSLNSATLRFNSTPASACSASANEAVFLDGAVISTASNVYTDSTGCSAGSNGYYSDGTYVRYASGGSFTTFASC